MTPPPQVLTAPTSTRTDTPPRPRPVSPAARDYLIKQGNAIIGAGGTGEDVQNFVRLFQGTPSDQQRNLVIEAISATGGNPTQDSSLIFGLSSRAYQGLTFGFGDEITGLFRALGTAPGEGTFKEGFEEGRQAFQDVYAAGTGSKVVDIITELAGGAATGGLAFKALGGAGLESISLRATAAASGALGGAAAGAGYAEGGVTDRAKSAIIGGVLGFAIGGAVSKAADVAGTILKQPTRAVLDLSGKLGDAIQHRLPTLGTSEEHARRTLAQEIQSDLLTPEQVRAGVNAFDILRSRISALRDQGIDPTIADAGGELTLGLMSSVLKHRTPIKQRLVEMLGDRQLSQGERLSARLFNSIFRGDKFGLDNAYHAVRDIADVRAAQAAPLYEAAHRELVQVTPRMREILGNPRMRAAYEEGLRIAQSEDVGRRGQELLAAGRLEVPSLPSGSLLESARQGLLELNVPPDKIEETLAQLPDAFPDALPIRAIDYMLQGIGKVKDRLSTQAQGANAAGRSSGTLMKEFMALDDQMDELLEMAAPDGSAFAAARRLWAGMSSARNAVEAGRGYLSKAPEVIEDEIRRLEERGSGLSDFYRLGVMQDVVEKIRAVRDPSASGSHADIAGSVFGGAFEERGIPNNRLAQALRAAFGSDEMAQDFYRRAATESRISRTAGAAGVGRAPSATSAFQEGEQVAEGALPFGRGGAGRTSALLNSWSLARQSMIQGNVAFRRRVADDMSTFFTAGLDSPQALDNLVDDLEHFVRRDRWEKMFRGNLSQVLGNTIGIGAGRLSAAFHR